MLEAIQNFWDVALWRVKTIGGWGGFWRPRHTIYSYYFRLREYFTRQDNNCQQNQKEILE